MTKIDRDLMIGALKKMASLEGISKDFVRNRF